MEAKKLLKQAEDKLRDGDFAGAQDDCDAAIREDDSLAEAYFVRSNAKWARRGKIDEVIEDLSTAVDRNPDYARAFMTRGAFLRDVGQLEKAIGDFSQVIRIVPGFHLAYDLRGLCQLDLGDANGAVSDFTKALERNSEYAPAYFGRGNAYQRLGQLDKALADFTALSELLPDAHVAYYNKGNVNLLRHEYDAAVADYTRAIDLMPDHTAAYCNRGNANQDNGKIDEAMLDYEAAIAIDPKYAAAYYNRGTIHYLKGQKEKAFEDWEIANKFDEDLKNSKLHLLIVHKCAQYPFKTEMMDLLQRIGMCAVRIPVERKHLSSDGYVMHYTDRNALESLAKGSSFRIMDAAGMRDPSEGKYFGTLLLQYVSDGKRVQVERLVSGAGEDTYVGSFVINSDEYSGDDMMWRLYGKHEHAESTGCALVYDVSVFAKDDFDHLRMHMERGFVQEGPTGRQSDSDPVKLEECYLFEVQYGSELSKEMTAWIKELAQLLQDLADMDDVDRAQEVVRTLLGPIAYRFKAKRYERECEARLMIWRRPHSGEELDITGTGRIYLECPPSIRPEKIMLGPALEGAHVWQRWLKKQPAFKEGVEIAKAAE